ncbi:MAG: ABC transporter substrate-binding protein [Proteobacteria bacterium]|nr:ABC transporter substrate-binding protein [Pseudomonadota bacterium]
MFLFTAAAPVAEAASEPDHQAAASFIHQLASNALAALRQPNLSMAQREEIVRKLLRNGFDVAFIGRFVLGRYWRQADAEQKSDYQRVFGEFLVKSYASRLGGYAGEMFGVSGVQPAGEKDTLVLTVINRPSGPPLKAAWRVRSINGQPRIIDVMVEGVSMVVTQRSEFASVIQRNGLNGLLEALRAKSSRSSAAS